MPPLSFAGYIRKAKFRLRFPDLFDDDRHISALRELGALVSGRNVAVVGNAESIFQRSDGEDIDGCDLVMRLNRGFIRRAENQGSRTDVVCLSLSLELSAIRAAFGDAQIVFASPWRWNISSELLAIRSSLVFYPLRAWRRLSASIDGRRPSTGLMAIDLCRNCLGARQVSLFGFDWKDTKTFYSETLRLQHHDWDAERRLVASWAREGRLELPPR
jgi:hypothetical protein